jgi:hypothetical protein
VDKAAAYLEAWAKEDAEESDSESRSDWQAYQARLHQIVFFFSGEREGQDMLNWQVSFLLVSPCMGK